MTESRQLALVTGASSGIGRELAVQFAAHDFDLVLCAEDGGLEAVAQGCRDAGADVTMVQQDLTTASGVDALWSAVTGLGRTLDAAALNAGVGRGGVFWETELEDLLEVVNLNVASTVHLARLVLGDMVPRGAGRVLITSSIASEMPGTYQAVYNASKSFDQSFAEALQEELTQTGSEVTITSLMPGPTETDFFSRGDLDDTPVGQAKKDDPALVAKQGFEAMMAGKDRVVGGGLGTKTQEAVGKVMPDRLKAKMHAGMAEPGAGTDS